MKGYRTRIKLNLSRTSLFERRKERIEALQLMLDRWKSLPEGSTKEIFKKQIIDETNQDKEYSATTRAFLQMAVGW